MARQKINFTKRTLEALPPAPAGKRVEYEDSKTPYLVIRVTATGAKSFSYFRRVNGKLERVTIGPFPSCTVEQARNQAANLNSDVAKGNSPADAKRAIREEITLGEMFERYIERHAKVHKRTWDKDQQLYDVHLSKWSKRKLSTIKTADFQKLHTEIGLNQETKLITNKRGGKTQVRVGGKGAANHLLRLLRTVFNKALEWGWEGRNPIIGVKEFSSQSRDRFLEADELPKVFKSLMEEPNTTLRDFFILCLLTGARKGNVETMRWDQINLERRTWFIPKTKNDTAQTVPLTTQAVELLTQRQHSESPWVFPSPTSRTGHIVSQRKAWLRILERAGIEDSRGTTIHDLRRSLGSWQAATGANLSIISKTLNHKNVSTTAIYSRLNIDPVRESMQKAVDAIWAAGGLTKTAEVVDIKKGKKHGI